MDYVKELEKQNEKQQKKVDSSRKQSSSENRTENDDAQKKRPPKSPTGKNGTNINSWCMLIHLSQFCTGIFPMAGIVVPIVLWQIKKDESEIINQHGRNVANWLITETIFTVISFFLIFACYTGLFLLFILLIAGIAFAIIGAVKASKGEVWRYPWAIEFIKG